MSPQSRLERYEQRTEWPLAGVAILFLALYSVRVLAHPPQPVLHTIDVALLVVYCAFVVDYFLRLWLARPRGMWFIRHLWELPVILLPFLRPLRLLSLAVVVNRLQRAVGDTIRGRVIIYTVFGATVIVYAASLAILDVEGNNPESKIRNLGDALWWAMTTVTTVGYGDLHPVTGAGRIVAAALMIAGITLLGAVTATLASWIVERVGEDDTAQQAATTAHINELREEIRRLEKSLKSDREDRDRERLEGD